MDISVVICTYNRAPELRRTLETMRRLNIPGSLEWELIVVDNNSSDDTPAVCDAFQEHLPVRYIFEPRQGLAIARNRGIAVSHGELIVFTDDDVDADPLWLNALHAAATLYPEAAYFGGKIIPLWLEKPPSWFAKNANTHLRGVTACFDLGERTQIVHTGFFGANMAFCRRVFAEAYRFREDIGRTPTSMLHGEETELFERLIAKNEIGCYVADALIYHRISGNRMTERYVRAWCIGFGVTNVRLGHVRLCAQCCGVPLSVWGDFLYNILRYGLTRWTGQSCLWIKPAIKTAMAWGVISELRKKRNLITDVIPQKGKAEIGARGGN